MRSSPASSAGAAVRAADDALAAALTSTTAGDGAGGVGGLGHEELTDLVRTLTRLQARADALLLAAVGEVDARGTHTVDGALTAGAWLRATARQTPGQAARTVRTARTLRSGLLPNTAAALAAGDLTGAHAAVIADAVRDAPAAAVTLIEPEAVAVAVESDVSATGHLMRAFPEALDPDGVDEAAVRRYQRAGLTLSPTLHGISVFSGTADETTGAVIAAALHAAGPPVRGDDRTAARRRLDALADICRAWLDQPTGHPGDQAAGQPGSSGRPDTGSGPSGADRPTGAAGASATSGTSPRTGATGRNDGAGTAVVRTGRHRTQLVVTLHQDAPRPPAAAHDPEPATCTGAGTETGTETGSATSTETGTETGTTVGAGAGTGTTVGARTSTASGRPGGRLTWAGPVTASTVRRLGCDSLATFVTLDPDGNVVEAGSARRYFTAAQRRALIARDGDTCCAPYCDRPVAWSDAHHVIAWDDGGPTTVDNGALPCEAHHLQLHEGHWTLVRRADGRYVMHHPPTGRTLGPEPPRVGHHRAPPAEP